MSGWLKARPRDATVRPIRTETRRLTAAGSDLGLKPRASATGLRQHRAVGRGRNQALPAKLASKLWRAGRCFLQAVGVLVLFTVARALGLLGPPRYVYVSVSLLVVALALIAWADRRDTC